MRWAASPAESGSAEYATAARPPRERALPGAGPFRWWGTLHRGYSSWPWLIPFLLANTRTLLLSRQPRAGGGLINARTLEIRTPVGRGWTDRRAMCEARNVIVRSCAVVIITLLPADSYRGRS